jgi:hypothetical protein
MVMQGNWATIRSSLCFQINSPGFSLNFMIIEFLSLDLPPLPADRSDFDVHGVLEDAQVTQNVDIY